jgi:hypothetical protein
MRVLLAVGFSGQRRKIGSAVVAVVLSRVLPDRPHARRRARYRMNEHGTRIGTCRLPRRRGATRADLPERRTRPWNRHGAPTDCRRLDQSSGAVRSAGPG